MNAILAYALAAIVAEISIDFEFTDSHRQATTLHGWIYDLRDGLLRDLGMCVTAEAELAACYEAARAGLGC